MFWLNTWLCSQGSKEVPEPSWEINAWETLLGLCVCMWICVCVHCSSLLSPCPLPTFPSPSSFSNFAKLSRARSDGATEPHQALLNLITGGSRAGCTRGRSLILVNPLRFTLHQQSAASSIPAGMRGRGRPGTPRPAGAAARWWHGTRSATVKRPLDCDPSLKIPRSGEMCSGRARRNKTPRLGPHPSVDAVEDAAVLLSVPCLRLEEGACRRETQHLHWGNRAMINPTIQTTENNSRISCLVGLLLLRASKHIPAPPGESLEASNITRGSIDDCNLFFKILY